MLKPLTAAVIGSTCKGGYGHGLRPAPRQASRVFDEASAQLRAPSDALFRCDILIQ
jgi:hypothetical protein